MAPTEATPGAGPPSPVAPLLDWDLGPASVATVLATVTDLPSLAEGGEGAWVTPFCLLACDYLRAAMGAVEPGMVPQVLTLMCILGVISSCCHVSCHASVTITRNEGSLFPRCPVP